MWVSALVAALAAAPVPKVAVVPVVREALIDRPTARRVEAEVRKALEKELAVQTAAETQPGLKNDPVLCEGNRLCFAQIGAAVKAWAVVRVEAVEVAGSLTVAVQAIDSADGAELAEDHFTIAPAALVEMTASRLAPIAARLKLRVPAAAPADAPVVASAGPALTPKAPAEPMAALADQPRQRRGPVPAVVTGAGALALAGAAAGFFAMGLDAKRCLSGTSLGGQPVVCVPYSQVPAKQAEADGGLVLGSVASALAGGLAITAVVLLVTD
jgi:hypothetical protein